MAKLKFENASLKNYSHFLETTQKNNNKKYESLSEIMAQYLEIILYKNKDMEELLEGSTLTIDINSLKNRDIKQWSPE